MSYPTLSYTLSYYAILRVKGHALSMGTQRCKVKLNNFITEVTKNL